MKKRILCLAMTMLMVAGASFTANAEDYEGGKDWTVSFTGEAMESNFKSAEMTEEILQIQPGDSITLQVNLKNDGKNKTDWYMANEVLQTLEESKDSAEGGAYTYILTYYDPDGAETVLYSSEVVGGEEDTSKEGEGLHQATATLKDYFYLDRLAETETALVKLYVKLDGETQGNDYQDTLARLKMNFAVEEVHDGVTTTVKTGDNITPMIMFSCMALASGLLLFFFGVKAAKDRKDKKGAK